MGVLKTEKLIGQPQRRLTSVYDLVKTRWVSEARAYRFLDTCPVYRR
jgi:hypothetical protein